MPIELRQPTGERPAPVAPLPSAEIDLLAVAGVLWRYRYALLALVVVVVGATYLLNRLVAPTYQATFRLLATESKVNDRDARATSMVAFRQLVESPSLVQGLLSDFKLDAPPYNLTVPDFMRNHVDIDTLAEAGVLAVSVRLKDRALVVQVADRFAERAIELAHRLNQEEMIYARDQIKVQTDEARVRLAQAEQTLMTFKQRNQIELKRKDMEAILERRPTVMDLLIDIETDQARLRQAEAELLKQQRVRDVRRSVELPPKANPEFTVNRDLLDPFVNPVYEVLERDVAETRTRLAGLKRKRGELVGRLKLDASSMGKLQQLYDAEAELARLTVDFDIARTAYVNAATRYEDARLQIAVRSARLQILDRAQAPRRPVGPDIPRNLMIAALLSLTAGCIAVFVFDSVRRRAA
ncbi:MAG TPA: Wzz/FepE/Etk N-terminal domain-containing protein [Gemmatimonadaceae bacterium]|nr:Wzz/FepE/Etk N-terminal domain-containing protein [Gemmatimonadaceae bacterium]